MRGIVAAARLRRPDRIERSAELSPQLAVGTQHNAVTRARGRSKSSPSRGCSEARSAPADQFTASLSDEEHLAACAMTHAQARSVRARDTFDTGSGRGRHLSPVEARSRAAWRAIAELPFSIRVLLEAALRNCDGYEVTEAGRQERWPAGSRTRGARRRDSASSRRASCCKISPACRASSTWRPCAAR